MQIIYNVHVNNKELQTVLENISTFNFVIVFYKTNKLKENKKQDVFARQQVPGWVIGGHTVKVTRQWMMMSPVSTWHKEYATRYRSYIYTFHTKLKFTSRRTNKPETKWTLLEFSWIPNIQMALQTYFGNRWLFFSKNMNINIASLDFHSFFFFVLFLLRAAIVKHHSTREVMKR